MPRRTPEAFLPRRPVPRRHLDARCTWRKASGADETGHTFFCLRECLESPEQLVSEDTMIEPERQDLTRLLRAWSEGDKQALEELVPQVQSELRRLAGAYMAGERPNHPLQTTALINEAYIRLIG